MGFKAEAIAYIDKAETNEKYTHAHILISKKIKDSNPAKYVLVFSSYVNFYGKAHQQRPLQGQKVRLKEVDVTNAYLDRGGEQKYNKVPNFVVYDYELLQSREEQPSPMQNFEELTADAELPF